MSTDKPWLPSPVVVSPELAAPKDLKPYLAYASSPMIRAAVKLIPWFGGFVDSLFALPGEDWRKEWLRSFLEDLSIRLDKLERQGITEHIPESPEWKEFLWNSATQAMETRSEIKRKCLANLVSNRIVRTATWNEVEAASLLLGQLSEAHIAVLLTAVNAQPWKNLEGLKVISIRSNDTLFGDPPPTTLENSLPDLPVQFLSMLCAQLLGLGLLHDEGSGRYGGMPMHFLLATDASKWFLSWIA